MDILVVEYICIATGRYSTANGCPAAQAEPARAFGSNYPSLDWVKAESSVDLFWHEVQTQPHDLNSRAVRPLASFLSIGLWM